MAKLCYCADFVVKMKIKFNFKKVREHIVTIIIVIADRDYGISNNFVILSNLNFLRP